jgi:hypothetical protein
MPADATLKVELISLGQTFCKYTTTASIHRGTLFLDGTVSNLQSRIAWAHNSGMLVKSVSDKCIPVTPFNNNRQFIKLNQSFLKELEVHKELFAEQSDYVLQEKMKISADALLNFAPDKISLEITAGKAIFYKVIKDSFRLFVEHLLINELDDAEETIVAIYDNDNNVLNYGGTLPEVIEAIGEVFAPHFIAAPAIM